MKTRFAIVLLLLNGWLLPAHATDHSAVMPFVDEDVAAIAYIDLKTDMSAVLNDVRNLGVVPQDQWDEAARRVLRAQRWLSELVERGASRAYVLLRTSDVQDLGPTWVLPLTNDADGDAIIRTVVDRFDIPNRPAFLPNEFQVVDGAVLAAMNKTQLERLATHRTDKRRAAVVAALSELGASSAGVVVVGDADSRRVLREMFPRLPEPFDQIDGQLIADDILWGGVVFDVLRGPKVTVHIETSGPKIAANVHQSTIKGLELAGQLLMARFADAPPEVPASGILNTFGVLKPTIEGTAVKLTLGGDVKDLVRIRELLTPPLAAAREASERKGRMNQFRQLALAFVIYESSNGTLVGRANYDQTGHPLLSWRVHLLPYLDQQALYAEFHLDEPWDSPHNRKLIDRMPGVFSDPTGAVRRAVGTGRTTYVAPVAAETLFPPREALTEGVPLKIRDVRDGVSKTILFVEVVPERAVVWTKPEDWSVNLDHPLQGVKRTERSDFVTAFCDAHVRYMSNDVNAQKLRALLTRDGGETVD